MRTLNAGFGSPRRALTVLVATAGIVAAATPAAGAQSLSFGPVGTTGGAVDAGTVQTPPAPAPPAPTAPAQGNDDVSHTTTPAPAAIVQEIYDAVNVARSQAGAGPLKRDFALEQIAQNWSAQQAAEDRMYHNPKVTSQLPSNWAEFGENVLQNWDGVTGQKMVDQWLNSPGHRANLLNPMHTSQGAGYALATSGKIYGTQEFAAFR